MVLIIRAKKQDPAVLHSLIQKGYGVKHPEKIHGYGGLFFTLGNVYVSNTVYSGMKRNPEYRRFILDSINRFEQDDYGYISSWEHDCNTEARWLFGGDLIGQYACGKWKTPEKTEIPNWYIRIRTYEGNTYVTDFADWDWIIREEEKTEDLLDF